MNRGTHNLLPADNVNWNAVAALAAIAAAIIAVPAMLALVVPFAKEHLFSDEWQPIVTDQSVMMVTNMGACAPDALLDLDRLEQWPSPQLDPVISLEDNEPPLLEARDQAELSFSACNGLALLTRENPVGIGVLSDPGPWSVEDCEDAAEADSAPGVLQREAANRDDAGGSTAEAPVGDSFPWSAAVCVMTRDGVLAMIRMERAGYSSGVFDADLRITAWTSGD